MPVVVNKNTAIQPYFSVKKPRKKKFAEKIIREQFDRYITYIRDNPIFSVRTELVKGVPVEYHLKKFRPFLKSDWCRFLGVHVSTWSRWEDDQALKETVQEINTVIDDQKLIGAYVNEFNASIASQELGLKTAIEQTNYDGDFEHLLNQINKNQQEQKNYENRRKKQRRTTY